MLSGLVAASRRRPRAMSAMPNLPVKLDNAARRPAIVEFDRDPVEVTVGAPPESGWVAIRCGRTLIMPLKELA